jgi:hypothetical protein
MHLTTSGTSARTGSTGEHRPHRASGIVHSHNNPIRFDGSALIERRRLAADARRTLSSRHADAARS